MKLNAIVLHSIRYRERDIIAYLYTQQEGRHTCLLHGLRKSGAALLQPLFLLEMEVSPPRRAMGMSVVREMQAMPPLAGLTASVAKTAIALFISEVLYRFIKEVEANSSLYDFLVRNIIVLNDMNLGVANFHLHFLTHLAQHLGYFPNNDYDAQLRCHFDLRTGCFAGSPPRHGESLDSAASALLWHLLQCRPDEPFTSVVPLRVRRSLMVGILRYYSIHFGIENPVRSLAILNEIFA